jgi:hypothetical protein
MNPAAHGALEIPLPTDPKSTVLFRGQDQLLKNALVFTDF